MKMRKKIGYLLVGLLLFTSVGITTHHIFADQKVSRLGITPPEIEAEIGDKGKIETTLTEYSATYTSQNPEIISVDQDGNWEAKSKGNTEIHISGTLDSNENQSEQTTESVPVVVRDSLSAVPGKPSLNTQNQVTPSATNLVPDIALKEAINNQLSRPVETDITQADLESLTYLNANGSYEINATEPRISSLEGLQYAINLINLTFYSCDFSQPESIAALENLKKLESLDISSCKLTSASLSYIAPLTTLNYLMLYQNRIEKISPLEPLFEAKLQQYRADPDNTIFELFLAKNPTMDYVGARPFFEMKKEQNLSFGYTEAEAEIQAANSTMRSINPIFWELQSLLDPDWELYGSWGSDVAPNPLPAIWALRPNENASPEKNRLVIKEAITDFDGKKALFGVEYNWEEDITNGYLYFPMYTGEDTLLYYIGDKTNGYNNMSGWTDDVDTYFTLETRESFDYPGETEYYYKGRDYNMVPYNPNATGPGDRQKAIQTAAGHDETIYYLEFKNFNDPVLLPNSTQYYYPTVFTNTGNTTRIIFGSKPFLKDLNTPLYNSGMSIAYEQLVNWINPEIPILEGLTDTTITAGTSFDPLAGISAFDPTLDQDNPEGATPKNITNRISIVSGAVDVNTPGTYTITYKVISPYGLETTGQRIITVVANDTPNDTGNDKKENGKLPVTGTGLLLTAGIILLLAGLSALLISRKRSK